MPRGVASVQSSKARPRNGRPAHCARARILELYETVNGRVTPISAPNLLDWKSQAQAFEAITPYVERGVTLRGRAEAERLDTVFAGADIFEVLGVPPLIGRALARLTEVVAASPERVDMPPGVLVLEEVLRPPVGRKCCWAPESVSPANTTPFGISTHQLPTIKSNGVATKNIGRC